ncbi:cytochrome P450 family protein [Aureobasidium sp. EXF-10727]|nr:cytochrome P450 family protein [Aureobasidium sp. EXF-10727]KAI4728768.1 cytochrome P450 family protein [Aureobasidium sp. EXF-10728]
MATTVVPSMSAVLPSLYAVATTLVSHYLITIFLAFALGYVVYQRFFAPLAGVPGPFWASLGKGWLITRAKKGDLHRELIRLHELHGPLVRVAPKELSVADLDGVKMIYGAGSQFHKSDWYSVLKGHRTFDPFAEQDPHVHSAQKKLVIRPYAMETLRDLEPYVDSTIYHFITRMREKMSSQIDLGHWFQLFAFDVIGEITFSKRFGFMDTEHDDGSLKSVESTLASASWLGHVPWVFWTHDFLMPYIGNWLGVTNRTGSLMQRALKEVEERKVRGTDRNDILEKFFRLQREKPDQVTDVAVISMAAANITAGSDTTAISLRSIIYHLLQNPQHLATLREELEQAKNEHRLSDPVTMDEADRLPFLQATILEGLRIHPAIGGLLPRRVPHGGCVIAGRYIPADHVVGACAWVINRNTSVFGHDAADFNPHRWIKGNKAEMQRYFLTFGGANRMCFGKNIAFMEMTKMVPTFLRHFDVALTDPQRPLTEKNFFFVIQEGLIVNLKSRDAKSEEQQANGGAEKESNGY